MAQPFGVGDVVGGRYRITHHVVTSADQDIVFQASDEVLDRNVSILLASRSNAKQVATSARELAMGARDSDVQVLDLGLADQRTYLISSLVDPNHLLDLVVPDSAPYVEPFFTDSLGSELFGQSRVMEPETFEDDDEYYAALHSDSGDQERHEDPARRFRRRRPAFLDKVSDSLNRRLNTENDAAALAVAAEQAEQARTAASSFLLTDMEVLSPDSNGDTEEDFSGLLEAPRTGLSNNSATPAPRNSGADAVDGPGVLPAAGSATSADASSSKNLTDSDSLDHAETPGAESADRNSLGDEADDDGDDLVQPDGEEVVDNPPSSPVEDFDTPAPPRTGMGSGPARLRDAMSFTGLIRPVPSLEDEAAMEARSSRLNAPAPAPRAAAPAPTSAATAVGPLSASSGEAEYSDTGSRATGLQGSDVQNGSFQDRDFQDSDSRDTDFEDTDFQDTDFQDSKPGIRRWLMAAALAAVLVIAAVVMFMNLRGGDVDQTADPAEPSEDTQSEPSEEAATDEATAEESEAAEPAGPEPEIAGITRQVPDSPDLIADRDAQLPNLFDGDSSSSWVTLSFATSDFGGLSSGVALVAELAEPAEISSVTVTQQGQSSGGSFEVLVNDSASLDGAQEVGSGTLNWNETTVDLETEGDTSYVIVNITDLPDQESPAVDGLPYSLELTEISVD